MKHNDTNESREQFITLPMFEAWLARSAEEFDRRQAESRAEFERRQAEFEQRQAEYDRQRAEYDRQHAEYERQRAEYDRQRAEYDRQHAEYERQRAEYERQRAEYERQHAEYERRLAESEAKFKQTMAEIASANAENQAKLSAEVDRVSKSIGELGKGHATLSAGIERVSKSFGELGNSIGGIIETLLFAHAEKNFIRFGFHFTRHFPHVYVYDEANRLISEIDLLMTNHDDAMALEAKRSLNHRNHVIDHLERLERIRRYPPAEVKGKQLLGAMAGGVVFPDVAAYAYSQGIFVLELTGESVTLIEPPANFVPRKW